MRVKCLEAVGELTSLPGCSQVVVSHAVFIPKEARGRRNAVPSNWERQRLCFEELGYDLMICTVDAANEAQLRVLAKSGWQKMTSFVSTKTEHTVELWCCHRKGGECLQSNG
jgi:hypothetical protein